MKTTSKNDLARLVKIDASRHLVRYLKRKVIDSVGEEFYEGEEVMVYDPDNKGEIISAIIRTRYSQDQVEALFSQFSKGHRILEFMQFQNWRDLAYLAADGAFDDDDFAEILGREVIEVELPFNATLQGGSYAALADYALKAKVNTYTDVLNNKAKVYLSFILPDHQALLVAAPDVIINNHSGLIL